jgi:hypothetical protein
MAFSVPTFNLTCNIWRGASGPPAPPSVVAECNLAWGRRVSHFPSGLGVDPASAMTLLLPVGTDIRSLVCATGSDWVEVPAGTGRFYVVLGVDDVGKGFPNEHRAALLLPTDNFGPWPSPIP